MRSAGEVILTSSTDWNPQQYGRFEDDRTRPGRDLLAQVPLSSAERVYDLGCGSGSSTELLFARYPAARIAGLDNSQAMLSEARDRLPAIAFDRADLATWIPDDEPDLLFANAVFQWVPNHPEVLRRLLMAQPPGGVLAVQMPDNTAEPAHELARAVAKEGSWAVRMGDALGARADLPPPREYYDILQPVCSRLDIWHTIYNHVLDGPGAIVEWFKGAGLRPYLNALDEPDRPSFLAAYEARIRDAYLPQADGKVLLRFPRLFLVATRR